MKKTISRIEHLFSEGKANIAYLTAGDGGMQRTLDAALALIESGINMLEIGIPFSDPIADGPVIQRATIRSIAAHTTIDKILKLAQKIRQHSNIPLILFSYLNPILAALKSNFFSNAKQSGIDALLLVDCPLEESELIQAECKKNNIDLIYVITPSTSIDRIKSIDAHAQGFLYYACRKGTTGTRNGFPEDFQQKLQTIKSLVHLPVVVGFGISNREMLQQVLAHADGVVVGSLFVKALEDGMSPLELSTLAKTIIDSGTLNMTFPQPKTQTN